MLGLVIWYHIIMCTANMSESVDGFRECIIMYILWDNVHDSFYLLYKLQYTIIVQLYTLHVVMVTVGVLLAV